MRILLVEDDRLIATPLIEALNDQHYVVDHTIDGLKGWGLAESFSYDLILLDVLLPHLDGISFCQRLRSQGNQTLILLLTAQDTTTKKVQGLDAGADDYVVKPFDLQELLARIRALLRRGGSALPPLLTWENLNLDPSTCEVTCESQQLRLTPKEYSLLELLLRNPQRVYSSSALIDHLWSLETPPAEETIRSHVKGLRHKLKTAGVAGDPIETVYGIGYRLRKAERLKPQTADRKGLPKSSAAQVEAEVGEIWRDIRDQLNQCATAIEQASLALQTNQLSPALRLSAEQNAHKLSGSLGMFGSSEGSRLAQKVETLLKSDVQPDQIQVFCQLVQALRQELHLLNAKHPPELLADDDVLDAQPSLNAAASPIVRNFAELCVANRAQSLQDLDESLALAKQEARSFSLAILNLESQQTLDRQHSQPKNRVIHRCQQLLRTQFRATDVIDYWGNETFVIGMGNTSHSIATKRMTDVLKALHEQALISASSHSFEVAFSAGIAGYPQDGADLQALYRSATQALEQSKAEGSD